MSRTVWPLSSRSRMSSLTASKAETTNAAPLALSAARCRARPSRCSTLAVKSKVTSG